MGQALLRWLGSVSESAGAGTQVNWRMCSLLAGELVAEDHLGTVFPSAPEAFEAQFLFIGIFVLCCVAGFML